MEPALQLTSRPAGALGSYGLSYGHGRTPDCKRP